MLSVYLYLLFYFCGGFKMITENVSFNLTSNNALNLSHLAVPGTARLLINMHWASVDKYDIYGAPIIPDPLIRLFTAEKEMSNGEPYTVRVCYELSDPVPTKILCNPDYVTYKLHSAMGFIEYLTEVEQYKKEFPYYFAFHEFIFYGKFYLNQYGSVMELTKSYDVPYNVMEVTEFKKLYSDFTLSCFPIDSVINSKLHCPLCLQDFALKDIIHDKIDWHGDYGPTHKTCQHDFYEIVRKIKKR